MAFIKNIEANQLDSHQTSPAYMLTFLRWSNRDTTNFNDSDYLETRKPLIVISDCIHLNVTSQKSSHIHQASMVLLGGDINYATAIAPGDFVLINMLDNDEHLFGMSKGPNNASPDSLYIRASDLKPINKADDGFKGVFKVQAVRRVIQTHPEGAKTLHYQISAAAFTEFNQVVYFNPYLQNTPEQTDAISDVLNLNAHAEWAKEAKTTGNVDKIFRKLVGFLIGTGFSEVNSINEKAELPKNFNKNFLMPPNLTKLMGVKSTKVGIVNAASFFNYYTGVEKYNNSSVQTDASGLNPQVKRSDRYFLSSTLSGVTPVQAEPWAQVTAWSILNQYSNSLINEMYTTFKLTPDNKVMPCVVFRQKPFTSSLFNKKHSTIPTTPFLSLPRWKLDPNIIYTLSMGRDEVARINFVHVVGKTRYTNQQDQGAQQASSKSYRMDIDDVKRNGLRPFIASCDFDFPTTDEKKVQSPLWNMLVHDWLTNGQLKENGTVETVGIENPIAVGDNCQINNTVYHIESISHTMETNAEGKKKFNTNLKLSYGVDARENRTDYNPIYPEMEYTDAESYRKDDFNNGEQIISGFSDSQDVLGRQNGEEITKTREKAFSVTPKSIASIKKSLKVKK